MLTLQPGKTNADVLVCGASYRQDVGDTRYCGSEIVVRKLTELEAVGGGRLFWDSG